MRRFLTAALGVALASCTGTPLRPCGRAPAPAPEQAIAEAPAFAGQYVEVTLEVSAEGRCSGEAGPELQALTVELTDESGRAVEFANTEPAKVETQYRGAVWQSTVRFQPARPGNYHVLATFEPIGLAQRDVVVVADRRGAPFKTVATPGADCNAVFFTARGSTVCRLPGGGAKLFRDNTQAAQWAGMVQVSGDVLWEVSLQGTLSRSVDLGSGPPALTHLSAATGVGEYAFSPRADEAVWWRSRAVEQLSTAPSQSLAVSSRIDVAQDRYPDALVWSPAAGTVLYGSANAWARIVLQPGTASANPVWQDIEALVAQERDALWARNGKAVRRIPADPLGGELLFIAPPQWEVRSDFARIGNYDTRPVFFPILSSGMNFTRALVPVFDGERAHLEYFEALTGTEFVDVTGGLLHARKGEEHYFWKLGP